jgi:predicted nucleic acid-binding Zn ribbon protein
MRKHNEKPLKAVIEELLELYRLKPKLDEAKVVEAWPAVTGEMVARNTREIYVRNGVLYVKVDSSALRNELLYARSKLITALNKKAGTNAISEIVIR